MTIRAYKLTKSLTQFAGVLAGFYALSLGADPLTTMAIIGAMIFGPEAMETLISESSSSTERD